MGLFSFLRGGGRRWRRVRYPDSLPPLVINLPPPPPRPRHTASAPSFTPVNLPWLSLRLPGEAWHRSGNPDAFEYVNPLNDEQLIVMVVPLAHPLTVEQQRAALEVLIDKRRDAVTTLSEGLAELSAPEHRQGGGHHEIRVVGINHKRSIQFAFLARASPQAIVNLSLYRYNVNPKLDPFEQTARVIFDHLDVKGK